MLLSSSIDKELNVILSSLTGMMKTSFDMNYLDFCQKPTKIY